jgi:carboxyl-terminal processing protease
MHEAVRGQRARQIVTIAGIAGAILLFTGFMAASDADFLLKINRSIDIFGRVYKEVTANYVDDIDPEKFMQAGVDGMLGTLDPYTVYIDKENSDEVDLLTSGKYGGVGVTIGIRDGAVRVISVMDGYSAQRQGMLPGDRFLTIGGVNVNNLKPDEIRNLTRGEPGTEVKVSVEREGEAHPLEYVLIREEIQVKNVTYSGIVENGIGYIRLERFSRRAGDEVRQAIREMKLNGNLRGVILDLRGNPGGLLDAAVDVTSKFVTRGSLVVSTKGRRAEGEKKYLSTEEPMLPSTPLVVLTDRNSASASEIVAGSLQDLDRGLIVGTRSFGKGLVQTIVPLNYGSQLKITTARYYIPSGRSIQEIDYMHRDRNGVFLVTPDSLRREFKTAHGRKVYELGGITPDSAVELDDLGPMVRELHRKSLFFKFANHYVNEHKTDSLLTVTPEVLAEFKKYLDKEKFDFQEESEKRVKELETIADKSHYGKDVSAELTALTAALSREKARSFERYEDHITSELYVELMARLKNEHGRIQASLKSDRQVRTAVGLLNETREFARRMGMAEHSK